MGVLSRYALLNAVILPVMIIDPGVVLLLGGPVLSEQIFNITGVGRLLIQVVSRRDDRLVQAVLMIIVGI